MRYEIETLMINVNSLAVETLLDRIHTHIVAQPIDGDTSLVGGQMGFALFEAYYQRHFGLTSDDHLWDRISACLHAVETGNLQQSFAYGVAGVAWGFLHLYNQGLLQDDHLDAQYIVEDLDEGLFESAMQLISEGDYDYLHRGLGAGPYFLERTPSATIAGYVEQLVGQLAQVAVRFPNGDVAWKFLNFNKFDQTNAFLYNLGLSHGSASIVALLSLFYERGYARTLCRELIEGNLQWMWRVRNKNSVSIFPNIIADSADDQKSPLGWCYGDLGIANAFWLAGEKLGRPDWQTLAVQTIHKAATRRGDDAHISDGGICHGAGGVSYLFRRFAHRTNRPLLNEAADYWFEQLLTYAGSEGTDDVFLSFNTREKSYQSNVSLLDGEAGIGLVLLSELGGQTHWDRFLLLS
ncbi:lanthionine synthetase C family protein [Fibrisoma limi BUZ 3]|uniref:Lanthionine synthetase C family protein n=2 Tax=Fibrisoma limi TaxID=663275 RepID=I2GB84_9BACT|nr:lanthionine synthetase C family protein [Fibrisoma limi BUZ 3]